MKILVALALISVCNANVVLPDNTKTSLDLAQDTFWDYVAQVTQKAEDTLKQIQASELGQEINTKLSQSADTVNQYVEALKTQAEPLKQEVLTQITQQTEALKTRMETELANANANLQPYAQQLMTELQTKLDELKRDVTPLAEALDPESLKLTLSQKIPELEKFLVDQLSPYGDELKLYGQQSMQELQNNMGPVVESFETQLKTKVQDARQIMGLTPQVEEELRAKLHAQTEDLRAQLTALWESFKKTSQ